MHFLGAITLELQAIFPQQYYAVGPISICYTYPKEHYILQGTPKHIVKWSYKLLNSGYS
jgi:hypothetical protein